MLEKRRFRAWVNLIAWAVAAAAGTLLESPAIGIPVVAVGGVLYFAVTKYDENRSAPASPELVKALTGSCVNIAPTSVGSRLESVSVWRPTVRGDLELWATDYVKSPPLSGDKVRPADSSCPLWRAASTRRAQLETVAGGAPAIFAVPICDPSDRVRAIGVLCIELKNVASEDDLKRHGVWKYAEQLCVSLELALSSVNETEKTGK